MMTMSMKRMSQQEIDDVQHDWEVVKKKGLEEFGVKFFLNLFYQHVEVFPMFTKLQVHNVGNVAETPALRSLGGAFSQVMDSAVASLHDPAAVHVIFQKLAKNHRAHFVQEHHVHSAMPILYSTLKEYLDEKHNEIAWKRVCDLVSQELVKGLTFDDVLDDTQLPAF